MDEEKALIMQIQSSAKGRNQMEASGPMGMGGSSQMHDMATLPPSANNRH